VVFGAGPEGDNVLEGPWEVVTAVGVDSLEKTERDPDVDGEDVEVAAEPAVQKRSGEGSSAENEDLCRVCVLGSKTEGSRVLVVNLVDMFVEGTPMKSLVSKVVEHILKDKEESDLGEEGSPRGERNLPGGHAEELG